MNTDNIFHLIEQHPEHEQLLLLASLSVAWLEPQSPVAATLIQRYRERNYDFAALRETALQLFLLAGFQTSLEAAFQIEEIYGYGLDHDDQAQSDLHLSEYNRRGEELQAAVYRGNIEQLRLNLEKVSAQLAAWTVWIGYGLVMSRPGLPPHWRELFEIAVLAVQGFPRQLHSHFRGALNLGASPDEVDLILQAVAEAMPPERQRSALHMWRRIRPAT